MYPFPSGLSRPRRVDPQASNKPLRGGKGGYFEGGVRTVAALSGGWLPFTLRGRVSSQLMAVADWYPTLTAAAAASSAATAAFTSPGAARTVAGGGKLRSDDIGAVDGENMWSRWLGRGGDSPGTGTLDGTADRLILLDGRTVRPSGDTRPESSDWN